MTDEVTLPEYPHCAADFERGVAWASGFFAVAQDIEVGLDEGQLVILAGIVKRLDQLDTELLPVDRSDEAEVHNPSNARGDTEYVYIEGHGWCAFPSEARTEQ